MNLDDPFPLEALPTRLRHVLVREFKGCCPSIREVEQVSDWYWLRTPGMGPASLELIHSVIDAGRQQSGRDASADTLSDVELLRRLEQLQAEIQWLIYQLKDRSSSGPRRSRPRRRHGSAMRTETDYLQQQTAEPEAPRRRNGQSRVA
jgi:hypothetical protein